jgi:hypothetical protein
MSDVSGRATLVLRQGSVPPGCGRAQCGIAPYGENASCDAALAIKANLAWATVALADSDANADPKPRRKE